MDQYQRELHQRELRRAAAQAFHESLDQLASCFDPSVASEQQSQSPDDRSIHSSDPGGNLSLKALEEADADIERFLRSQSEQPTAS